MKKSLLLLILCAAALSASATVRYVSPSGSDSNDGLSWANAKASVKTAVNASSSGDEVYVAAGTYNEMVSIKDGVNIRGGYNASTGARDIDLYKSILDGTNLGSFVLVKYDNDCTVPTYVEGMVLQNTSHSNEGGGAFIRGNVILDRCIVRNCDGGAGGGVYARCKTAGVFATISNTTIELCNSSSSGGGAYLYENAKMENCIVRGCTGKYGAIRSHKATCIVSNCVIYNNTCTIDGWPGSAGIFNEAGGKVYNCTVVNNQGLQYAGIHSVDDVYNSVFWGNLDQEGDSDPANFISGSSASSNNYADEGFDGSSFASISLNRTNMATDGPNFNNPTAFVGIPTNAGEIAAMQAADWSLLSTSPLINQGRNDMAPATDILGVARPIGGTADVGAYEYDPNATPVAVTGLDIYEDTVSIIIGQTGGVTTIITPGNATNKRLTWSIDHPAIATVDPNGAITGVALGNTVVHAASQENPTLTASAVVVIIPVPPTKYPDEYYAADTLYHMEDYTVPSFIPFLVAKEGVRIDSLNPESDLSVIPARVAALNTAISNLVGKDEPYNMIANINGDPHTHMAFCWFTNEGVTNGVVQVLPMANATENDFATVDGVITIQATPTTTNPLQYAVSTSGIIKAANIPTKTKFTYVSHKALAENLTPGTAYSWRCGFDGHWSPIGHFKTQDADQGEFSFLYMSDSHIMDQEYVDNARWCATAAAATVPDARFCLFPGDFVETGTKNNSEWEWERWFEESIRPVIMQMPIVPTDGNHDDSENLNYDHHFNTDRQFNIVAKTKPQFNGITYSFVYGDVLFLVYSLQDWWRASGSSESTMTSSYLSTDVRNWFLEQCAAHPDTKYRVALSHKNIFSGSGHSVDSETPMFREIMLPIFKACEIDLAVQGHDHCYEVIGPVDPDTRTAITSAISDVEDDTYNAETNMTGKKGGTYVTDDGTLYFIGATCGRKRYYPYSRAEMEENFSKHKVENYFDLFTGMFGQPKAPSFTKFTVKEDAIELNSYKASSDGTASLFNTMQVKRTKPHSKPNGFDYIPADPKEGQKFIRDGHLYILRNGRIFDATGKLVQ